MKLYNCLSILGGQVFRRELRALWKNPSQLAETAFYEGPRATVVTGYVDCRRGKADPRDALIIIAFLVHPLF